MDVCSPDRDREPVVREVVSRLDAHFGRRRWTRFHGPLDELVLTMLSQHTSDVNSERAFQALRAAFPTWAEVRDAPTTAVAAAIRGGGLATVKAPRIQAVLASILSEGAGEPLDDLATLPLTEAKARLQALPGVGPKTAACVLLFACGRPALPVDTHVYRVSQRIGLIDEGVSAAAAHEALEGLVAPGDVYTFHLNMIQLGRLVCVARVPRCEICPLTDLCCYYARYRAPGRASAGDDASST